MKVKTWHIGCLVILVLAALYFLVGTREGLDNSSCWEDVLDGSTGKFIFGYAQAETALRGQPIFSTLDQAKTACASDTMCKGVVGGFGERDYSSSSRGSTSPPPPATLKYAKFSDDDTISPLNMSPLPAPNTLLYYRKKPCGGSSSSASSPPSVMDDPKCPVGAPGISSVTLTGGQKVRLYTANECSAMGGNFAANGKKNWGMANDSVGECLGTSNGINVGFCNQGAPPSADAQAAVSPPPGMGGTAPMPPGPTGTSGGASMNPTVPSPTQSTASYPAYSLTCRASPVSGMVGSVGMPETPAAWNVSQPPSGWNSKNGYTTTGN